MKFHAPILALALVAAAPVGLFACDMMGKKADADAGAAPAATTAEVAAAAVTAPVAPGATAIPAIVPVVPGHPGARPAGHTDGGAIALSDGGLAPLTLPTMPSGFVIPSAIAVPTNIAIPSSIQIPTTIPPWPKASK